MRSWDSVGESDTLQELVILSRHAGLPKLTLVFSFKSITVKLLVGDLHQSRLKRTGSRALLGLGPIAILIVRDRLAVAEQGFCGCRPGGRPGGFSDSGLAVHG